MADDIIDAHEQSERARQWLQQNGSSILVGVLLALATLFGWQRWQQSGVDHRAEALLKFERLQDAFLKDDLELANSLAEDLRKNFRGTAHAGLAALKQAEQAAKDGRTAEAESALRFVVEQSKDGSLGQVATLRLARLLVGKGEAESALKLLEDANLVGYDGERDAVRADALALLGRQEQALEAYDRALAAADVGSPQRRWLQMRRDDLATGPATVVSAPVQGPAEEAAATAVEDVDAEGQDTEQGS